MMFQKLFYTGLAIVVFIAIIVAYAITDTTLMACFGSLVMVILLIWLTFDRRSMFSRPPEQDPTAAHLQSMPVESDAQWDEFQKGVHKYFTPRDQK